MRILKISLFKNTNVAENDFRDLEFLAEKSKEFIDKQISAYRQKHANAGSVIAIIALFVPFFLNGLSDSYFWLKVVSIIPVLLFLISVKLLLDVLRTKSLDQGFHPKKFDSLVKLMNLEEVLLYEIGANRSSFEDNEKVTGKATNGFNLGIRVTLVSVVLSISILLINSFFKPEPQNKPQKIEIVNFKQMENNQGETSQGDTSGTQNATNASSSSGTVRDIPIVPPTDRINLNESIIDIQTKVDTNKKGS